MLEAHGKLFTCTKLPTHWAATIFWSAKTLQATGLYLPCPPHLTEGKPHSHNRWRPAREGEECPHIFSSVPRNLGHPRLFINLTWHGVNSFQLQISGKPVSSWAGILHVSKPQLFYLYGGGDNTYLLSLGSFQG